MLDIKINQPQVKQNSEQINNVFEKVTYFINTLPLFKELGADFSYLLPYARRFRQFKNVIIFGTGGSSLSGEMFSKFKKTSGPRIHFFDNVDSYEWEELFQKIDLQTTGIIAISKSGNTTETLCQTLMAIQKWKDYSYSEHFLFVSDPTESALREIAEYYSITCLDHPSGIGGRFSAFSIVGILPALIAGLNIQEIVEGAQFAIKEFLNYGPTIESPFLAGAFLQTNLFKKGINISVMFCYANRLLPFARWCRQLVAESLGKKVQTSPSGGEKAIHEMRYGMTPVIAAGTVDQHSQLQLYMDGPKDKFFTVLTAGDHPITEKIEVEGMTHQIMRSFTGHTMAELMIAHQQATTQNLMQEGYNVRSIHINEFNEKTIGQMMMFYILETLAIANIWNIDPFNQPGVKGGKDSVIALMQGS